MARSTFGGSAQDGVFSTYTLGSRQLLALASTTLTFWDAETGGTQYTDLLLDGAAVSSIPTGLGQVPTFQGPDGVTEMWADDGDSVRTLMVTQGRQGPPGDTGPAGPEGPVGPASTVPGPQGPPGEPVGDDATFADFVQLEGTATRGALHAAFARRDWIDLRDWNDLDLTGTNDNLPVLNAAVAQAGDGDTLVIPSGLIAISGEWAFDKSINIEGTSSFDEWPTRTGGFDRPTEAPFMRGTVLMQTAGAANGITLTGAAQSTHIRNLGIRFLGRFDDTGHGIQSTPPAYLTGQDHGVVGAMWDNVRVYGHDGNHYAFDLTNPLLNSFRHLRSYGGGVMHLRNNGDGGNYGNTVIDHLYGNFVDGGTAHGIHLEAVRGMMNLLTFIRPQVNVAAGESPAVMPAPPQKFVEVTGNVSRHNWIGPDFEGATSGMDTNFGSGAPKWIDPTGIYGSTANKIFIVAQASAGGTRALWSDMTFGGYSSQALSNKFNGAALGSGAPAIAEVVASDDWRGYLSFGSGTTPTTGIATDIRYNKNRGQGNPIVFITPANAATAALGLYVAQQTAVGFTVGCTTAPAASQPAGTYAYTYRTER